MCACDNNSYFYYSPIPETMQEEPPHHEVKTPTPQQPTVSFEPSEQTERRDYKTLWRSTYRKICKDELGYEITVLDRDTADQSGNAFYKSIDAKPDMNMISTKKSIPLVSELVSYISKKSQLFFQK
jgi:hypothetical protein